MRSTFGVVALLAVLTASYAQSSPPAPLGSPASPGEYASEMIMLNGERDVLWQRDIEWTSDHPLFVVNEQAVTITKDADARLFEVLALSLATGNESWRTPVPIVSHINDTQVVGGKLLILHFGGLLAVDLEEGDISWTRDLAGETTASFVTDGVRAYVSTHAGVTQAIDVTTGNTVWDHESRRRGGSTEPLLHEGTVIVGRQSGPLFGLDASTGEQKWRFTPAEQGRFRISLGVADGVLAVLEPSKRNRGQDHAGGISISGDGAERIWTRRVRNWDRAWLLGKLVVSSQDGGLLVRDLATGQRVRFIEREEIGFLKGRPFSHTFEVGVRSVIGLSWSEQQKTSVWRADATANVAWTFTRQKNLLGPWSERSSIYVWQPGSAAPCGCPGKLLAIDQDSGSLRWNLATERPIQTSPIETAPNTVLLLSDFGVFQD